MNEALKTPGMRAETPANPSPDPKGQCLHTAEETTWPQLSLDKLAGLGHSHVLVWKLQSDALSGFGVKKGDILIINKQNKPQNGQLALISASGRSLLCKTRIHGDNYSFVLVDKHGYDICVVEKMSCEVIGAVDFVMIDFR